MLENNQSLPPILSVLHKLDACVEAQEWASRQQDWASAWENCGRADWMIHLATEILPRSRETSRQILWTVVSLVQDVPGFRKNTTAVNAFTAFVLMLSGEPAPVDHISNLHLCAVLAEEESRADGRRVDMLLIQIGRKLLNVFREEHRGYWVPVYAAYQACAEAGADARPLADVVRERIPFNVIADALRALPVEG